ncbi:MAG: hypothetical protein ACRDP7_13700, partial [Trebonia sp.]
MFYGSNLYRKDNPRWVISNATETPKVPDAAFRLLPVAAAPWDHTVGHLSGGLAAGMSDWVRSACGVCASWVIGLPRRAGVRLYALNDAEARWWHWQVTERRGGLVHKYRDPRFASRQPGRVPPDCPRP